MRDWAERGTISVITAVIMMALVGSLAMVVDLGYAFGQRRLAQNTADSAALAGAKVLAIHIQYPTTTAQTDAGVLAAIEDVVSLSPGGFAGAYTASYVTDLNADGLFEDTATEVGSLGAVAPPSNARGVKVVPSKQNNTFIASVLGHTQLTATARATALVQPVTGFRGLVPYAIWGGEERHLCNPPNEPNTVLGGGNGNLPNDPPPGYVVPAVGRYGCNLTLATPPGNPNNVVTYKSSQWQNDNIQTGDTLDHADWWGNSNNFKGFFHDGNTTVEFALSVGQQIGYDIQGGVANGALPAEADAVLENCWDLMQSGVDCTVVMPVVDHKSGGGNMVLRVVGFAVVELIDDPTGNPQGGAKRARVLSTDLSFGAIVGTSCPAASSCQYAVKLVQ